MPWPERQRRAIFLSVKRRKGEAAARAFMHKHGYGNDKGRADRREAVKRALKKRTGR